MIYDAHYLTIFRCIYEAHSVVGMYHAAGLHFLLKINRIRISHTAFYQCFLMVVIAWTTFEIFFFKVRLSVIYLIESPLKMMKNAFYFIVRALFILKIFKFLS